MTVKRLLACVLLISVFCYSCKKSNNATVTSLTTAANIDSLVGHYQGTTSGDSVYDYTDSLGNKAQWVHSFSVPDTLIVTSPDTATILVTSKYYSVSFPYGDSLTFAYVTNLQNGLAIDNGYFQCNAVMTDTTDGPNHMIVNLEFSYTKNVISNVTLYQR